MTWRSVFPAAAAVLLAAAARAAPPPEDVEMDEKGAEPKVYVRPAYPAGVGVNGTCNALFDVRADGAVDPPSLSVGCTNPVFVRAVQEAMAQWRFEPVLEDGVAVADTGFSAVVFFSGGDCVRVASGNFIDKPCAASR